MSSKDWEPALWSPVVLFVGFFEQIPTKLFVEDGIGYRANIHVTVSNLESKKPEAPLQATRSISLVRFHSDKLVHSLLCSLISFSIFLSSSGSSRF